jgi:mRNA interferase RelE/StbE
VYEIWLERSSEKDLKRLEPDTFKRVIKGIKELSENPKPAGCRKITGSKNDWRIRIGDYRVIYEIDDKANAVKVMIVKHRREAYR